MYTTKVTGYIYRLYYIYYITFTFSHLADAFIQSDLNMRTMEQSKPQKSNKHASAVTSLSSLNTVHYCSKFFFKLYNK